MLVSGIKGSASAEVGGKSFHLFKLMPSLRRRRQGGRRQKFPPSAAEVSTRPPANPMLARPRGSRNTFITPLAHTRSLTASPLAAATLTTRALRPWVSGASLPCTDVNLDWNAELFWFVGTRTAARAASLCATRPATKTWKSGAPPRGRIGPPRRLRRDCQGWGVIGSPRPVRRNFRERSGSPPTLENGADTAPQRPHCLRRG